MPRIFKSSDDCCGCSARTQICPSKAISMIPDSLGFLYPQIDNTKCTDCGLCEKVCSFRSNYDLSNNLPEPLLFGLKHGIESERMESQSGGAFALLSDWVLEQNGAVYGAGYADDFTVLHKRAENKLQRNEFRGSKYVQSNISDIFPLLTGDLKSKKYVLFSGTPCQTAAIHSFVKLKKLDDSKLFLVDLICHGAPAPFVWKNYLTYLEQKFHDKIIKTNFRDKQFGWREPLESYIFKSGKSVSAFSYTYLFYKHIMLRLSCGKCPFTNYNRPSDITVGDFWGIEKSNPDFAADNKGVSLVIVNSQKGRFLFDNIKEKCNFFKTVKEDSLQSNLQRPSPLHKNRKKFENDFSNFGFVYINKKYGTDSWNYKIKRILKRILKILGLRK